jgi:hypothetical protein
LSSLVLALFCGRAPAACRGLESYAGFKRGTSQAFLTGLGTGTDTRTDQVVIVGALVLGFRLTGKSISLIATRDGPGSRGPSRCHHGSVRALPIPAGAWRLERVSASGI